MLASLTAGLILAGFLSAPFRRWLLGLDWRSVVALHLSRFVGIYFLWLYGHGQLPRAFAVPGGVGDILVAMLAAILLFRHRTVDRRPMLLRVWNLLGLVDLLFVVATASRLARANPLSMAELVRLPLSLLPTFLVPILLASHVLLLVRPDPTYGRS